MSDERYIYRVQVGEFGGFVEVAIFDPDRWAGEGGAKFGFDASVQISMWKSRDTKPVAQVSMGGISAHSPEEAEQRIDVYKQAADIARFVNDMLAAGQTLTEVGEFLDKALVQDVTAPATSGFVYHDGYVGPVPA